MRGKPVVPTAATRPEFPQTGPRDQYYTHEHGIGSGAIAGLPRRPGADHS